MTKPLSLNFLLSLFLFSTSQCQAKCYAPNGSLMQDLQYAPCARSTIPNIDSPHRMCCKTNTMATTVNKCRDDGLCEQLDTGSIWRESCTDPTWKDPSCLKLCINGLAINFDAVRNVATDDTEVTPCADGSICCGLNSTTCCTSRQGFWIVDGKVYAHNAKPVAPSNTTSSSNSTSSATSTSIPLATNIAPNGTSMAEIDSNNLKYGLGIGLGIGLPILTALIGLLIFLKRRKQEGTSFGTVYDHEDQKMTDPSLSGLVELPDPEPVYEAPSSEIKEQIGELPA